MVFRSCPIFNLLPFLVVLADLQSPVGSGRSSISCGFGVLADLQPPVFFWVLAELQSPVFFGFWQNLNLLWVLVLISGRSSISCGFEVLADLQPPVVFGFWPIFNLLWFFGFWPIFNLQWFLGSGRSSISCVF